MPYTFFGENSDIVELKPSKIAGAGTGLFAKKRIKEGQFICWYFGVLVDKDMVDNGYYDSDYLLKNPNPEKSDLIIDAHDPLSCFGRYANDSLHLRKNNSDFEFYTDIYSASLVATKNIKKGEEIYVSYGSEFWREPRRYNMLSDEDKEYLEQRHNGEVL